MDHDTVEVEQDPAAIAALVAFFMEVLGLLIDKAVDSQPLNEIGCRGK